MGLAADAPASTSTIDRCSGVRRPADGRGGRGVDLETDGAGAASGDGADADAVVGISRILASTSGSTRIGSQRAIVTITWTASSMMTVEVIGVAGTEMRARSRSAAALCATVDVNSLGDMGESLSGHGGAVADSLHDAPSCNSGPRTLAGWIMRTGGGKCDVGCGISPDFFCDIDRDAEPDLVGIRFRRLQAVMTKERSGTRQPAGDLGGMPS